MWNQPQWVQSLIHMYLPNNIMFGTKFHVWPTRTNNEGWLKRESIKCKWTVDWADSTQLSHFRTATRSGYNIVATLFSRCLTWLLNLCAITALERQCDWVYMTLRNYCTRRQCDWVYMTLRNYCTRRQCDWVYMILQFWESWYAWWIQLFMSIWPKKSLLKPPSWKPNCYCCCCCILYSITGRPQSSNHWV